MSDHVFDELPSLLRGEADRATLDSAAAHLRQCEDCRDELVSSLVAHASLSSAARFAPDAGAEVPESPAADRPLPDLSELFDRVHAEAATRPGRVRSRRTWAVAAAVAIGVAAGGGAVVLAQHVTRSSPSARTIALAPYDRGATPAEATLVGRQEMKLNAASLPAPGAGKLYEVWLTNGARTSMHPLGWIGADGKGDFTVPANLMSSYTNVEVSVQAINAPYEYSGTSVLRGTYG